MLRLQDVSKGFVSGRGVKHSVLRGLNLTLEDGDFAILLGANGCGKSTLLRIVAGEVAADSGSVLLGGANVASIPRRRRAALLSYIPQKREENLVASLTVLEVFTLAMSRGRPALALLNSKVHEQELVDLLRSFGSGLENRIREQVRDLSGGEHQFLAVLLAAESIKRNGERGVLLLDEHVVHLDPRAANTVMRLTEDLVKRYRLTTLMVTHNVEVAAEYGDRILIMADGRIGFDQRFTAGQRPDPAVLLTAMAAAYR